VSYLNTTRRHNPDDLDLEHHTMEGARTFETFVSYHNATRRHNTKEDLKHHHRESLKTRKLSRDIRRTAAVFDFCWRLSRLFSQCLWRRTII